MDRKNSRWIFLGVLSLVLLFTVPVVAQNKVVVIPLMEEASGPSAPVPKSGQTKCFNEAGTEIACAGTGQDGDIQAGMAWPNPRCVDHGNGTVTDKLTGLIWLKEGDCDRFHLLDGTGHNNRNWEDALDACNQLASPYCSLSDGSVAGAWRLPNRKELESLIDLGQVARALPPGCPLSVWSVFNYWSATTSVNDSGNAWYVVFDSGRVSSENKSNSSYVFCVR